MSFSCISLYFAILSNVLLHSVYLPFNVFDYNCLKEHISFWNFPHILYESTEKVENSYYKDLSKYKLQ